MIDERILTLVIGVALIVLPLVVAGRWASRSGASWGVAGLGALAFVASQFAHVPLLVWLRPGQLPELWMQCVALGLLAGLCEEPARWLMFRYLLPAGRRHRDGVMAGLGHGGFESMLIGLFVLISMFGAALPSSGVGRCFALALELPVLAIAALVVAERAMAVTFHVAMSLVVLDGVRRNAAGALLAAVLLHSAVDAGVIYAYLVWGALTAEILLLVVTLGSVAVIASYRSMDADA